MNGRQCRHRHAFNINQSKFETKQWSEGFGTTIWSHPIVLPALKRPRSRPHMPIMNLSESRWLGVWYKPQPEERSFIERTEVQHDEEVTVFASVL